MKKIAVFFGGKSTKHDISIISAVNAINVLKHRYNVLTVYIGKLGDMYLGEFYDVKLFKNFEEKKYKKVVLL